MANDREEEPELVDDGFDYEEENGRPKPQEPQDKFNEEQGAVNIESLYIICS